MSDPAPQPPIIPGYYEPAPAPSPAPAASAPPTTPRRRRWLLPALAAIAVPTVAVAAFLFLGGLDRVRDVVDAPAPQRASTTCGQVGQVADGGKTLILNVINPEAGLGPVSPENLACVLRELGTPAYVVAQMAQTRALDGRQTATWGDLEASWTYHPDNGLNLIIHQKS
jgi:hypothetical protein